MIRDSAANLYGTTTSGGAPNCGVVCKLDAGGNENLLYSFTCLWEGNAPYGGVILDSAGNLYGTTLRGGQYTHGVVYKI